MSARPRVLLIGPLPNPGDVIGGTKVSFAELVEGLRARGRFEVEVHDTTRVRRGRGALRRKLDDAIGAYERGIALKKHCETKLSEAKAKVEKIAFDGPEPTGLEPAGLE